MPMAVAMGVKGVMRSMTLMREVSATTGAAAQPSQRRVRYVSEILVGVTAAGTIRYVSEMSVGVTRRAEPHT